MTGMFDTCSDYI